jgi:hypothetical protein
MRRAVREEVRRDPRRQGRAYGRELVLTRYTEPEPELSLLLNKLKLELPANRLPKLLPLLQGRSRCSADLRGLAPANSDT